MADPTLPGVAGPSDKAALRVVMRQLRRALSERDARSVRLWDHVRTLPAVPAAERIMVFSTIVGEPEVGPFLDWCRQQGIETAVPESSVDPSWPDVVIVPALALTPTGARLGQGGGWYDRFLADLDRSRCVVVGVCFAEQVVDSLPTEPHDVVMDHVVTDERVVSTP